MAVKTHGSINGNKEAINSDVKLKSRLTKLEKEFEETRYELSHSFDAAIHGIRIINRDFTVRRINRAFAAMVGVNQFAAAGKKCWEVFPGPFCHTPNCRLSRILEGEDKIQAEINRTRTGGSCIPCRVMASAIRNEAGEITGVIEQFHDLSENLLLKEKARESEELAMALFNLGAEAGEAIVMLQDIGSKEAVQTYVNDQWLKITGYTREELLGTSFADLLGFADRQLSLERHRLKMSGLNMPGLFELDIIRKNHSPVPVEVTGHLLIIEAREPM